jgi:colanic acid/amylovoran biosynthesis protein
MSAYYEQKFLGLADQFGAGCNVVFLQDKYFNEKLMVAIEDAWNSAVHIRPQLLEAAKRQIESGKSAYRRLYNMVESGKSLS